MTTVVGVSGDVGSFSEEAALLYAKQVGIQPSLNYLIDMEGVLAAVGMGKVDLGIFPVVNNLGGLVKPAFAAMGRHLFIPVDEIWLTVHQCLLAQPGILSNEITKVVSHPQALAQCKQYLQNKFNEIELIEWCDTAKAAKDLAAGNLDPSTAVIASEHSAHMYGLQVMAKSIQDSNPNLTAFIVAKKHG